MLASSTVAVAGHLTRLGQQPTPAVDCAVIPKLFLTQFLEPIKPKAPLVKWLWIQLPRTPESPDTT